MEKFDWDAWKKAPVNNKKERRRRRFIHEIWLRDGSLDCHYCHKETLPLNSPPWRPNNKQPHNLLTIDHITPRSKDGADDVNNLVIACYQCNQQKGTKSYWEWILNEHVQQNRQRRKQRRDCNATRSPSNLGKHHQEHAACIGIGKFTGETRTQLA